MSHQITWYILAHMPCFRRPSHLYELCKSWHIFIIELFITCLQILNPAIIAATPEF